MSGYHIFSCEDIVSFLSIYYHSVYHCLLYNNFFKFFISNIFYNTIRTLLTSYSYISYNIKVPTTLQLLTNTNLVYKKKNLTITVFTITNNKQLLHEVGHDIMNYQNRGLRNLPKPKAEADNTDTRF